jgi:hypothetical protein
MYSCYQSFFNLGAGLGWVVIATSQPLYPRKETQYPIYRRLERPQGWSGWVWKIPTTTTEIQSLDRPASSKSLQ